ncbi:MAG TPA: TIGR02444 family protein, partial [Geminicoccaceae bacterium]|nr:TIGR02444 family protein [Geminicoccaceae bacterium]
MDWPRCPFWTWSVEVYGRDGVAAACLELQDRHGLDVNLLLLACWLAAAHGRALDGATLARARAASGRWQAEVVRPLRAARRALKAQLATAAPGEVAHGA